MQFFIQNEIRAMQSISFVNWKAVMSTLRMWLCNNLKRVGKNCRVANTSWHVRILRKMTEYSREASLPAAVQTACLQRGTESARAPILKCVSA